MRIKAIKLAWFRGAADPISLEPDCKSMVVYGVNGSGKSSFVDAIEYVLNDGRIGHLAHEYSGKHQERAIANTHKPKGRKTELGIKFKDDSELKIEIMREPGRVFSRSQLLEKALGYDFEGTDRTVDVHILNLRRKIEQDSNRPRYILTVYGMGYKFGA